MSQRFGIVGSAFVVVVMTAVAPASAQFVSGHHHHHHHGTSMNGGMSSTHVFGSGFGGSRFSVGVIGPYGWGGGFASSYPMAYYGSSYGGMGYGGSYWGGGYYAAPLYIPAGLMFGPSPVMQMMGGNQSFGGPVVQQPVVQQPQPQPNGFGVLANPQPNNNRPARPNVMAANPQTQQRARKTIDAGDVAFQQQRFAEALGHYKDAARIAPDLADAYFRQAAAQIALGRYEDAAAAIKFGLRLSSNWVDSQFRFAALYGPAALARQQHLSALEQAANNRPTSDVLFVHGVALFFDDHPRWAQPPLERARALAVGDPWHINLFLQAIEKVPPDAAPRPAMPQPAMAQPVNAAKPLVPDQRPLGRADVNGARDI